MKGMHGKNNGSTENNVDAMEMKKNMTRLLEQNEKLAKEIESLKRGR